jgi:two-component system, chemotaxis family, CheB/CheR fusion protein
LRGALLEAIQNQKAVVTAPVAVEIDGQPRRVTLAVSPWRREGTEGEHPGRLALVLFLEDDLAVPREPVTPVGEESVAGQEAGQAGILEPLQAQVHSLSEELVARTEEYETAIEELRAANEELQSLNEEFRSAAEELETSKEELQSVNEELQTVNNELKHKLDETARARNDLENLMTAIQIATLFLDRDLRIQRFTPSVQELFNIVPGDRGRSISHLTRKLDYPDLEEDARRVLRDLTPLEREVGAGNGAWFLARLRPYRTLDDRIEGVVLTLVDITDRKHNELALLEAKEYAEAIVMTIPDALLVLDEALRVRSANEAFYEAFHVSGRETEGVLVYELGNGQWNIPELRRLLEKILPENKVFTGYEVTHTFQDIGRRSMLLNGRRLDSMQLILLAITDITRRKEAEEGLRATLETMEERVQARTEQVRQLAASLTFAEQEERQRVAQIIHDDLQQRLYSLLMRLNILRQTAADPERFPGAVEIFRAQLEEAVATTRTLSTELNPPVLENNGMPEALRWLVNYMWEMHGLAVDLDIRQYCQPQNRAIQNLLIQMARELLFNIVKHAGTLEARAVLERTDNRLHLRIEDEGAGFDAAAVLASSGSVGGLGLHSIVQRLKLVGGDVEVQSTPAQGSRITLIAPCAVGAEAE